MNIMHAQNGAFQGTHFYVAGFGKVGKATAHALASLGADVTVVARSDAQLGEACYHGYKTEQSNG